MKQDDSHERPHSGIGGLTPVDIASQVAQPHPLGHLDSPRTLLMSGGKKGSTSLEMTSEAAVIKCPNMYAVNLRFPTSHLPSHQ